MPFGFGFPGFGFGFPGFGFGYPGFGFGYPGFGFGFGWNTLDWLALGTLFVLL